LHRVANSCTQRTRILERLISARGDWVPLPEITACAAQYNARIFELRRLGFQIENRTKEINGVRHSWFRLINQPSAVSEKQSPGASRLEKAREWLKTARGEQETEATLFGNVAPEGRYPD
jgi:hypothetical protein